ncbi:LuxO repressor protein [Tepidicaulis marinus]|uniref:LuxO repressor protein n=1 Tax=Tepidicaulis marinus TaxID=1333998 RepID=A0A081BA25_9HYPH|nr:DNA-binding response regulator [Tepidicaulis marinus]GAK44893.1 LuxO repressor protein [Tepidicaulis marinus]
MTLTSTRGAKTGGVLIVGDDSSVFGTLTAWLDSQDISSQTVSWNGLQGRQMLAQAYDLIVVDLRTPMPDWLMRLGRVDPASTILMVNCETDQVSTGAHPPEAFQYVAMPCSRARFLSVMEHSLQLRRIAQDMNEAQIRLDGRPLWELEREVVEKTIRQCSGSIPSAARRLGVSPSTLYRKREAWTRKLRPQRNVAY